MNVIRSDATHRVAVQQQLIRTADHYLERSIRDLREIERARIGSANSILWIVGHVTVGRCRLRNALGDDVDIPWTDIFGKGSNETPDTWMPSLEDVLELWRSTGSRILELLADVTDEQLLAPPPVELPEAGNTTLGLVDYLLFHEAYHIGQIAHMRKALGHGMKERTMDKIVRRLDARA